SLGPAEAPHGPPSQTPWPKSSDLLPGGPERYDYVTRKLAIGYSGARAQELWEKARYAEALPWFQDAARVGFDFPSARMNLSVAAGAQEKGETIFTNLFAALHA